MEFCESFKIVLFQKTFSNCILLKALCSWDIKNIFGVRICDMPYFKLFEVYSFHLPLSKISKAELWFIVLPENSTKFVQLFY